ncbi:MAG: hypothetical protein QM661_05435 [Solimonas sp.]
MIPEKLKTRLKKDRDMTTITLRVPVDVVESLKAIAPHKGMSGYQALLKAYVSEGCAATKPCMCSARRRGWLRRCASGACQRS